MNAKYAEGKKRTRPPQARFSDDEVADIRKRRHEGGEKLESIALDYNATTSCIQRITSGLAYKDLPMYPAKPRYYRPNGVRLSHDDVRDIRRRKDKKELNKLIAYDYGIAVQTVSAIYTRKLYKHVSDEVL